MTKFTKFTDYRSKAPPTIPKPETPPEPMIVTVQEGVPVVYPDCVAPAVRVVHPVNPSAPAKNMGLVMFYIPPHAVLEPGSHETEETYVILEGEGTMTFGSGPRPVKRGDFVYLPPWCLHGIENTGTQMLVGTPCSRTQARRRSGS